MERGQFDALARLIAAQRSRRSAIAALLGATLLGPLSELGAAKRKGKQRDQRRREGKGSSGKKAKAKGNGKSKRRTAKDRKARNTAAEATRCCSTGNCTPGKGKNLQKCCYQGQDLSGKNFQGANLGSANLAGATLTGANLHGANLGKTCLVDADLRGVRSNSSTNLAGAVNCRTQTNNGENNSGCAKGTPCCPTCDDANPCGDDEVCCNGRCIAGNCCDNGEQSTCDDGHICCGNTCVEGDCCEAAGCPNEICQRRSCRDNQCVYSPVTGEPGPRCQTVCCEDEQGEPVCCQDVLICDAQGLCCQPPPKDVTCGVGTAAPKCGDVTDVCDLKVDCGPCAPRTCADGTCTGEGDTCEYVPVFGEPGTGCQTICCEDDQGNPACCAAGTTICQTNGVCGCARQQDCDPGEVCCGEQCVSGVCCEDQDCPQETCQAPDCQGNQCGYTPVRGEPGPGCQTVCCQNGQEDPVCCGTGVTTCLPNGLCGCANCGAGNVCENSVCIRCDVCASGCAYTGVEAAIAAGLTSIRICPGTYATSATIPRGLELIGSGSAADDPNVTILDGGFRNRVLDIAAGVAVTVRTLRIQRGRPDEGAGGGVLNAGALTMEEVAVFNCGARAGGGGIESTGSLTLTDCDIDFNETLERGGGIEAASGSSQVTLLRTRVQNNRGNFGAGGINISSGSLLLKTGTSVAANTAAGGGGIAAVTSEVTLEAGSSVTGNRANGFRSGGRGGGILTSGTDVVVTLQAGSSVSGNEATISGGGVQEDGGTVNVANTGIVTGNTLTDGTTVSNCAPSGAVPNCTG